jgi:hypothetical protein
MPMTDWIKVRGEAVIGSPSVLTPFARYAQSNNPFSKLSVSPDKLTLSTFFDSYTFGPQDVVGFEPGIQLFRGEGFRIRHCVGHYPEYIVFRGLADPRQIIRCIEATGFSAAGTLDSVTRAPTKYGSPWRPWVFLLPFLPLVGVLVAMEFSNSNFNLLIKVLKTSVSIVCISGIVLPLATLRSKVLQRLFLKSGRSILEVRGRLRAGAFGSAVSLLILSEKFFWR